MNKTARSNGSATGSNNIILKTKITALLLVVLLLISLTGCTEISGLTKERAKAIKEDAEALRITLEEAFSLSESPSEMLDAVIAFADENEIYYRIVNDNAVILVKQAPEDTGDDATITMHCSISPDAAESSAAKTAAVLTALQDASNHSRTTAVITLRDGLFYTGAMALPADYLDTDRLINISDSDSAVLFKNSASLDTHRFSHELSTEPIADYKAYELSIDGLSRSTPEQIDEEQTDPVMILYEILNWCEQTHIDYRLSSFKAGDSVETLPQSAVMTISVDPTDVTKFQNKVYGMIQTFKEEHGTSVDSPVFTLRHIEPLTRAIAPADTTDLLGLIYTLLSNFDYLSKNETDKTVGRQDFSLIDISEAEMNFTISCRFMDASEEHDDSSAFKELARLNNFNVLDREIYPRWTPDPESLTAMTFDRCAEEGRLAPKPASTVDILETGVFAMKKENLSQLAVGISPEDCANLTKTLVLFIETEGQATL